MIFAEFRLDEAQGVILAHSLRLPDRMMKKGRVLSEGDLFALRAAGVRSVAGARLEPEDLGEDDAAAMVAEALAGANVEVSAPFTGRCNVFAGSRGLAVIDRERLDSLNLVDEAVAVATVPPWEPVEAGQLVATVKIIPFGVPRRVVETCAAFATAGGALLRVEPFRRHRACLILTQLTGTKESVLDETGAVIRARLEALDSRLELELRCPHEEGAVERALSRALETGCDVVVVSGASATADRRDVVPRAIERAGGTVEHFGMPVDPGNLLLLARHGGVPIIGMPGCARSPKLNGLDWVMQRLLAGQTVRPRDIMLMGAGGLLKNVPSCPLPGRPALPRSPRKPRIAALVLAAGQSRRMGRNKLLIEVAGKPLVAHVVDAALGAHLDGVYVVTGNAPDEVRAALGPRPVQFVHNPDFASGMAASLKRGITALPSDIDGVLVCPADMPHLATAHLGRLAAAFDPDEGRAICVPVFRGRRGNPALLGRLFFDEIATLEGDIGARNLIAENSELVFEVQMDDDAVLVDIDTPEELGEMDGQ